MAKAHRTNADVLAFLQALQEEPYRHGFAAAMRRMEALYSDKPRLGEAVRANDDPIRLGQHPSLAFAPASVAEFTPANDKRPPRLDSYFFGLFGPNGPLPLHLTEYAHSRELNDRDSTFRRFADVFHHRLLSLFFRAWMDCEPTIEMDRPDNNRFDLYVGSVLGIGPESLRQRDALSDRAKLFRSASFAMQTRPVEALRSVLIDFFKLPFDLQQWVGEWLTVEEEDRCYLGRSEQTGCLGQSMILGGEVWSCQHKFRVVAGPLEFAAFNRLLPGTAGVRRLLAIVRNLVGDEFEWDLQLILRKSEVPKTQLGEAGQLGWTSWLGDRPQDGDADDVIINVIQAEAILADAA